MGLSLTTCLETWDWQTQHIQGACVGPANPIISIYFKIFLTEGDMTGPGDGIPPEDMPGDIGFAGPTPAPCRCCPFIGGALNPFWL